MQYRRASVSQSGWADLVDDPATSSDLSGKFKDFLAGYIVEWDEMGKAP